MNTGMLRIPTQLTRWDATVLVRAASAALLALAVAWLVTAATDEGGITWGERAGRTLPLTPVCAAVGVWGALAQVRARGEALALAALGRSPGQIVAAAVVGAAVVALAAAGAIAVVPSVSVAGFFPVAASATAWQWDAGWFVDVARGLRIGADGAATQFGLETTGPVWSAAIPAHGRAAAAVATAISGLALPMMLAHALFAPADSSPHEAGQGETGRRGIVVTIASGVAVVASIVAFQAAAAHQVPAMLGIVPPAALLAIAVYRYASS